jgi:predicted Zn-dependent peptidase
MKSDIKKIIESNYSAINVKFPNKIKNSVPQKSEIISKKPLKKNSRLCTRFLENGLRYVILPNNTPPQYFEAHLEIHAGSVDETEEEQGIAHLVEHISLLGSPKRQALVGSGARSNAYTDFHHVVFHYNSPLYDSVTGKKEMIPCVLEALADIAFKPEFQSDRVEKERKAVLSEAQMMNTIEYRIDLQLLRYLHEENELGC